MQKLQDSIDQVYKTLEIFQNRIKAIFSLVRIKEPSIKLRKSFDQIIRTSSLNETEIDYCLKEINLFRSLLYVANSTKNGMQHCVYNLIFAQKYVNETLNKHLFDAEVLITELVKALDFCLYEYAALPREVELCIKEILDLSIRRINSTMTQIEYNIKFCQDNFTVDFLTAIDCMVGVKSDLQYHYNHIEKLFRSCAVKFQKLKY